MWWGRLEQGNVEAEEDRSVPRKGSSGSSQILGCLLESDPPVQVHVDLCQQIDAIAPWRLTLGTKCPYTEEASTTALLAGCSGSHFALPFHRWWWENRKKHGWVNIREGWLTPVSHSSFFRSWACSGWIGRGSCRWPSIRGGCKWKVYQFFGSRQSLWSRWEITRDGVLFIPLGCLKAVVLDNDLKIVTWVFLMYTK